MEDLTRAIYTTPIIDNHAHPLLLPEFQNKYPLLAITTEAHGEAMKATKSSLSHIRAVKQLSDILGCSPTWEDVVTAIKSEKTKPHHLWEKRCLEGIETILIDDGLDGKDEVYEYGWHDKLTRSECKKIVRIERLAEQIIDELYTNPEDLGAEEIFSGLDEAFDLAIKMAIDDPDVVGFKSVICYRTGLDIPPVLPKEDVKSAFLKEVDQMIDAGAKHFKRLDSSPINAWLVDKTAAILVKGSTPLKPFQFHTGLGDSDITLTKSSPSHLQEFIRKYPDLPIVLLHASYPWTKEAGYLATVYPNVYADIGEVFPFLSKEGQENVIREILELCPTEKILWSTDGHWFPETYLLAIIQVREALEVVLTEYVKDGVLTIAQAVRAVEDIFFNSSNTLYDLGLSSKPFPTPKQLPSRTISVPSSDYEILTTFISNNPAVKFIRLQYLDYTSTPRLRVIPVKKALESLRSSSVLAVGITKASLGLLQNDTIISTVSATGEYRLQADLSSLHSGPYDGYACVQGNFKELDGTPATLCPRTILSQVLQQSKTQRLDFLLGFEIEVVFLTRSSGQNSTLVESDGHAWSTARSLHSPKILEMFGAINKALASSGIDLEQWHSESATGQYEFVLPPRSPLEACDMVLHAREIITTIAAGYDMRATLYPKVFAHMPGTASHIHISIVSPGGDKEETYKPFYAGILKHLPAILAFTYSSTASYDRMADGCWAGGRWAAWGTQNRETALRKIVDSHFEIKVIDGMANVYLAVAVIIAAGTKGVIEKEAMIWKDCAVDPASLSASDREELGITKMLPKDLPSSLKELEGDEELIDLMGREVVERYIKIKEAEIALLNDGSKAGTKEWIIERY